jgi:hypothetical protein
MALKSIGLGLHFFLEIAALAALVTWGFQPGHSWWQKILLGIGIPVIAAALWAVFRVPNDPGQALVPVPGALRLLLELVILGGAAASLYAANHSSLALWFAGAILVDYLIMIERVGRLLNQS